MMNWMRQLSRWSKHAVFGLAMAMFSVTNSLAQTAISRLQDMAMEVPGHPGISYFDLLKQIVPDLGAEGTSANGRLAMPLRHIAEGYGGEPLATLDMGTLEVLTFMVDGLPRIAILTGIGSVEATVEQPVLLAVFDDGKVPKLLDAVDVGMDRDTSLGEPALVNIGKKSQALVVRSSHFNSSESFETTALILPQDSKLKLADTFSTYGARTCGAATRQVLTFEERPGGTGYSDILATIRESTTPTDEVCDDESLASAPATSAGTLYNWDAKALNFVATSDALEKFQLRTAEQMGEP
ncbi:hypothetical protein [Pararhizobium sp. O133]|uniref:hypothetical protein n=1 Tax=Pararhizobium sp. O133 TaxID=3449278 RepID=UPI003F685D19